MKIAFLSFYSGKIDRGVETFTHELANRLATKNTVTVYQSGLPIKNSLYQTKPINAGADWSQINHLRHLSKLLFFDFNLQNILRRFYLDYWSRAQKKFTEKALSQMDTDTRILITAGSGWVSLLSRLWSWRHHARLIISAQSGPGWDDRINLFCRPDVIVGLTKYQVTWLRKNCFGVKVVEIPNGVDLRKFNPSVQPVKINLSRPIFFCAAALEPGKHIDTTIRAVAKLRRGSLVVAGRGKLKSDLEKLAFQLLPKRFSLVSVSHEHMPAYYTAADVVTMMPPLTESFGIVFLEGLAANKPVVTTSDPARREIIGKAGLFVDLQDINGYALALEKALSQKWGNAPRLQAEKYSWDKIVNQYEKLFQSL